jgi:predicted Zn-dependent protease
MDKKLPKDGLCIVAVINRDLFTDEENSFVMGVADPRARKGVFSLYRYFINEVEQNKSDEKH